MFCSGCGKENDRAPQRYCYKCHARTQREWRKKKVKQIKNLKARIAELEAQLQAEGEHTAAANANIDRLNTEIERVTRRQQGPLMGKD